MLNPSRFDVYTWQLSPAVKPPPTHVYRDRGYMDGTLGNISIIVRVLRRLPRRLGYDQVVTENVENNAQSLYRCTFMVRPTDNEWSEMKVARETCETMRVHNNTDVEIEPVVDRINPLVHPRKVKKIKKILG